MSETCRAPTNLATRGWSSVLKPLGTTYNRYARTIEDWETGALPDAYIGGRNNWTVQSSTVDTGSFAARALNIGLNESIISRDDQPVPTDSKLTAVVLLPSGGMVGVAFGGPAATGANSWSGYVVRVSSSSNEIYISRYDNGSPGTLDSSSPSVPGDEWITLESKFEGNGTITARIINSNGSQIGDPAEATDTEYSGDAWGSYASLGGGYVGDLTTVPLADASLGLATL